MIEKEHAPVIVALFAAGALYWHEAWPFNVGGPLDFQTEYMPEVAYRVGTDTRWWVGDRYSSSAACWQATLAAYGRWAQQSDTRVISAACRVMRGQRFLDRTRG